MTENNNVRSKVGPVWEKIYEDGNALNRYPFDQVVSFLYRNYSRIKPREQTKILEIGCGAGNNLWFAAREGFSVVGIDGSPSAIEFAKQRFYSESLIGDFRVADFTKLPFKSNSFDFVIDRAALTCSNTIEARKTILEVKRVLAQNGLFFFNPYSDHHSSFSSGTQCKDGLTNNIISGTLTNIGPIRFYGKKDILSFFDADWKIKSLRHLQFVEELFPEYDCHAEWILIAERIH